MKTASFLLLASLSLPTLACAPGNSKVVAQVGDYPLTQKMVDLREKVAKVYYPKEPTKVGLLQLTRFYTYAQILKNHNRPVTDQALEQEEKRIDANTRDPDTLNKIKDIFGKDHESYRKVFILPAYVDRIFYYDFFLNTPELQAQFTNKAEEFFREATAAPQDFVKLAQKHSFTVQEVTLDPNEGLEWQPYGKAKEKHKGEGPRMIDQSSKSKVQIDLQSRMEKEQNSFKKEQAQHWLAEVVANTKPGALFHSLVDMQEQWVVLKYLGKKPVKKGPPQYLFHAVNFPKADFSKWLTEEQGKVVVTQN